MDLMTLVVVTTFAGAPSVTSEFLMVEDLCHRTAQDLMRQFNDTQARCEPYTLQREPDDRGAGVSRSR